MPDEQVPGKPKSGRLPARGRASRINDITPSTPAPAPAICPECGEWSYQCVCGDGRLEGEA